MRHVSVPATRVVALFALLCILPLVLLTYLSTRLAAEAVRERVESELASTAAVTSSVVDRELSALENLVESYAARPSLASAAEADQKRVIARHLFELRASGAGIEAVILTSPEGIVRSTVPATPELPGTDLSYRDWYRGVTASGRTYLSDAFTATAGGRPIVASAAPVRDARGRTMGYLAAGYEAAYLRELTTELSRTHSAEVRITDRSGVVLANAGQPVAQIVSRHGNPAIRAALRGNSGFIELDEEGKRHVTAYAPVADFRWAVSASRPADSAYAAVGRLRNIVYLLGIPLALVLLAGLTLLTGALSARRRAERAAEEQATIARTLIDSTPDAVAMMKSDGEALFMNAGWREVVRQYGMPETARIAEVMESAAAVVSDPEVYRKNVRAFLDDPERKGTLEFDTPDGRSWRVFSAPVRPPGTPPLGRIFSLSETTHERQVERAKEGMVATVSHELRTPLASIVGFVELLAERDPEPPVRKRYLETVSREAKRLTELINDFLDIQGLEGQQLRHNLAEFDLGELVQRESERVVAGTETHRLEIELTAEPLLAVGDSDRIAQVLVNLLTNAVKYSPAGGTVTVRAERSDGNARISVTDEGLGIAEEHKHLVFGKFFRVDSSDTRLIGGTGLGLALAREIVRAHGGRIGFESGLGEGSTFWFEIPLELGADRALGQQPLDRVQQV